MDDRRPGPDWLTTLLLGATLVLLAGLAAVGADLWIWPPAGGLLAEAAAPDQPVLTEAASPQPDISPSEVVAAATGVPPTEAPTVRTVPSTAPTEAAQAVAVTFEPLPATLSPCVPPAGWALYAVKGSDTLGSIARRCGTDVETLMQANCLNVPILASDQQLYVPMRPGATATATPEGPGPTATVTATAQRKEPAATATMTATPQRQGAAATVTVTATPPPTPSQEPRPDASATPVPSASSASLSMAADGTPATPTPVYVASLPTFAATATPKGAFQLNIPNRYVNIVLLGSDKRVHGRTWRTDSMIIVSIDVENNLVRLLSIPRDLWVYIPHHGYDRINTAELWAELSKKGTGIERIKQTIHHNLGIPIHYYVRVDFRGFMKIVDTVGGVDIDVDCPLPDIKLEPGIYHMDGAHALQYARSRHSTSDFDRGRRQRKVLTALWDKSQTMDIIPKLPSLWVTLADSFETDLPFDQVVNLAYIGVQLKPQHIISKAIGRAQVKSWMTPGGAAVLLPRDDQIRTLLEDYYAPVDPTKLNTMDNVRIQVLNGTQRRDAEKLAVAALRWEGIKIAGTGEADRRDYAHTEVRVYQGDLATGERVARELKVPLTAVQDLTKTQDQGVPADLEVQVILGKDYNPCQR